MDLYDIYIHRSRYATVGSTAAVEVVTRMQGKLPPPGLYGPFATGDFAFWNGDFTLVRAARPKTT